MIMHNQLKMSQARIEIATISTWSKITTFTLLNC